MASNRVSSGGSAPRLEGVVRWFSHDRGFGFLQPADGGADVFYHIRAVVGPAVWDYSREGRPVTFIAGQDRRGRVQAYDVRPAD